MIFTPYYIHNMVVLKLHNILFSPPGKQSLNNVQEIVIPKVKGWIKSTKVIIFSPHVFWKP